jgi:hypothetical protein
MRQHQDLHTGRAQVRSQRHRSARPPPKLACRLANSPRRLVPAGCANRSPTSPSTTDAQPLLFGAWSGGIGRWRVDVSAAAGHRAGASADDAQTVRRRFTSALNGYACGRQSRTGRRGQLPGPPVRPGCVPGHGRVAVVAPVRHQLQQHGHGEQPEPCPEQDPAPWCPHATP